MLFGVLEVLAKVFGGMCAPEKALDVIEKGCIAMVEGDSF
jgi:hypothetical protein